MQEVNQWHDDIAESFPERRDDEPGSLRDDIAAELADHLSCALNRELLLSSDEKTAIQRVLDRFGDPRTIARKLWFDSMKEKLMGQRITLAASIFAAVASIAACALVYVVADQSRAATQMFVEQGKALVEEARAHSKMQQEQLAEFRKSSKNVEFNSVKIRLVTDAPGNPPAVGCSATLMDQQASASAVDVYIDEKSDAQGDVDFGILRYGTYNLMISTPNGERASTRIRVALGKAFEKTYLVPAGVAGSSDVSINVQWPDDLRSKKLLAHCMLMRQPRRTDGLAWYPAGNVWQTKPEGHHFIVNSDGEILFHSQWDGNTHGDLYQQAEHAIKPESKVRNVKLPAGMYQLKFVVATRPLGEGYPLGSMPWGPEVRSEAVAHVAFMELKDDGRRLRLNRPDVDPPSAGRGFANPRVVNDDNEGYQFEAKQGEANRWAIVIPADAIQSIRDGFESLRVRDERNPTLGPAEKQGVSLVPEEFRKRNGREQTNRRERRQRFETTRHGIPEGATSAGRAPVEAKKPGQIEGRSDNLLRRLVEESAPPENPPVEGKKPDGDNDGASAPQ